MSLVARRNKRLLNDDDDDDDDQENNMIEEEEDKDDDDDDDDDDQGEGDGKPAILIDPKSSYLVDRGDGPPVDDCCPICFGTFSVACKSLCGHWYCGSCILQYWKYCAVYKPCKCPMCNSRITNLTPEASLHNRKEREVVKVLQDVQRYNRIVAGGVNGLVEKVSALPFLIKRVTETIMDADGRHYFLHRACMRWFALMLAILYMNSPFDFIPVERREIVRLFDGFAQLFFLILQLVGIYRRWRLNRRVRDLAAAQPLR